MNFLAHCLLADHVGAGDGGLAGAVLGDFLKGSISSELPDELALGVRLHRRVDSLSNRLPGITESIQRFPPPHRRYAPIYVDIIADHLLARSFGRFCQQPLTTFSQRCYRAIDARREYFPQRSLRFVDWMIDSDLLASYTELTAVEQAIGSLQRRMRRPPDQTGLSEVIDALLSDLADDFRAYFPALQTALTNSPEGQQALSQS